MGLAGPRHRERGSDRDGWAARRWTPSSSGSSQARAPVRAHLYGGPPCAGWYGRAAEPRAAASLVSALRFPEWDAPPPPRLAPWYGPTRQRSGEGLAQVSLPLLPARSGGGHAEFRFLWLRPRAGGEAGRALSWRPGSAPRLRRTPGLLARGGLWRPRLAFRAMVQPEGVSVPRRR